MVFAVVVCSVLLVLLIFLFVLFLWIYKSFFYTPIKNQNDELNLDRFTTARDIEKIRALVNRMREVPYEDLYIKSNDGLRLHAFLYENKASNIFVVMFNGYRGISRRDNCGKALNLMKLGYNVILCDQRGHGLSEGHLISLGHKEQHDVVSWVNFIKEKWGNSVKITVTGVSMGASTVLLASDKLPEDVKVFADSPYSNQKDLIKHLIKHKKLNPTLVWPLVFLSALIFGHVRLNDDVEKNVKNSKCQILMIHGTEDTIVPIEMNKSLYSINKENVHIEIFEGLNHALAYLKEPERYGKILQDFLNL